MPDSTIEQHRAQLEALVNPFRDQLAQVEADILAKEAELIELRDWRRKLRQMLAPIDPTLPRPGRKTEPKTKGRDSNEWSVSEETAAEVETWLRKTFREEPFSSGIAGRREDRPASPEPIRKTIHLLTERGILRLDHIGAKGAKFYVFTGG